MLREQHLAGVEVYWRFDFRFPVLISDAVQREEHGVKRAERVCLHPPQRAEPDGGQRHLELADVNLPDGQIVQKVACAVTVAHFNPLQFCTSFLFKI